MSFLHLFLNHIRFWLQNLKCRTTDHSRRQGEFIDIAEECNNSTAGDRSITRDRSPSGMDSDYYSSSLSAGQSDRKDHNNKYNNNHNNNNRRYHAEDSGRNNNREFNVHRQDYGNNNNNNNRGNSDNSNRDMMSCDVQPQQYSVSNILFVYKYYISLPIFLNRNCHKCIILNFSNFPRL